MLTVTLPNKLSVEAANEVEAQLVYREIFELETYDQQGIVLNAGDCIFDIGANIGLYTLKLAQTCADVKVYAFEPIPALYAILEHNAAQYAPNAKLFPVGLGAKDGKATFE